MVFDQENGGQAARNIPFLTKATLAESGLTHHIIANLTAYSQLTELNLRLAPESHQWGNKPMPLMMLKWEVPTDYSLDGGTIASWNEVVNVLNIASTVFPEIVELDISYCIRMGSDVAPDSLSQGRTEHRQDSLLPRLQTFRYLGDVHDMERELMLDFVRRNSNMLTSLAMAFGLKVLDQRMMEYILQVVTAAPKLKSLIIPDTGRGPRWQSHSLPVWSDQTPPHASPTYGIEFFEMWNIGCSFSPAIGQFFSGWNNLRILKIGAPLYEEDIHDGRPHFDEVAPVRQLPNAILYTII